MAPSVKVSSTPETDPKEGKARAKSGVSFPYFDLAQSIEVAATMHSKAGGECDLTQLATLLGYSGVRNGSFRMRVSASKSFGLIDQRDDEKMFVTSRGQAIVAPIDPASTQGAKVEAFLAIDLFKKVFDRFHGGTLPGDAGMRNLLETTYKVVPDRIVPTVRIMMDSAEQAGLFDTAGNRSRMVMPLGVQSAPKVQPRVTGPSDNSSTDQRRTGGNGGGGAGDGGNGDNSDIDPAIRGILRRLPPGGTPITAKRRKALIDAFTATVGFIYPEADDESVG